MSAKGRLSARKARVLIVDDCPLVRSALRGIVEGAQDMICCGEVESSAATQAAASKYLPDLVLLELWLAEGICLDLVGWLKQQLPQTTIMILTASSDPIYVQRAFGAGADGYVTNVALRKGARVAALPLAPAMAFIDTSETIIGVEIAQIDARYIEPGQEVELTFKYRPGEVFTGRVEAVLQATAAGQVAVSGSAVTPKQVAAGPFVVRVRLDDQQIANELPAGSTGEAAIYTEHVKPAHFIRRVILRQMAILNYINPF